MASEISFGFVLKGREDGSYTGTIKSGQESLKQLGQTGEAAGNQIAAGAQKSRENIEAAMASADPSRLISAFGNARRSTAEFEAELASATTAIAGITKQMRENPSNTALEAQLSSAKRAVAELKQEMLAEREVTDLVRRSMAGQSVEVGNLVEAYRRLKQAAQDQPTNLPSSAINRKASTGTAAPSNIDMGNVHQAGNSVDLLYARIDGLAAKMADMGHLSAALFSAQYFAPYIADLGHLSDRYISFNAQLKLAVGESGNFAQAQTDVLRIATTTAQGLSETGMLYARLSQSVTRLGFDQQQVARITETVGLSLKVSGASAAESSSAIMQLSQSFASGVLRGEEFNAVNEASPRLMQALADAIGKPKEELKQLAEQGQLTSKLLALALPQALDQLRTESASMPLTIGQSFTLLENKMTLFIGKVNDGSGVFSNFASSVKAVADNLEVALTLAGTAVAAASARMVQSTLTRRAIEREAHIAALAEIADRTAADSAANQAALSGLARLGAAQKEAAAAMAANQAAVARAAVAEAVAIENVIAAEVQRAAATVAAAKAELSRAEASARANLFVAGSLSRVTAAEAEVTAATTAHTAALTMQAEAQSVALARLGAAQKAAAAEAVASSALSVGALGRVGVAARGLLGFLTGPMGIVISIGLAAAAWIGFKEQSVSALDAAIEKERELKAAQEKTGIKASPGQSQAAVELAQLQNDLAEKKRQLEQPEQRVLGFATGNRAAELEALRASIKEGEAIIAERRASMKKAIEDEKKQQEELKKTVEGLKTGKQKKDPAEQINSGIESMQMESVRRMLEANGASAAAAAAQVKVYELAIKGATKEQLLAAQAAADSVAANDAAKKSAEVAAKAEKQKKEAWDQAASIIERHNQAARQAVEQLDREAELDGKGAIEKARSNAERRVEIDLLNQKLALRQKYKDNPDAAAEAVGELEQARPKLMKDAGDTAARAATVALGKQADTALPGGAEQKRFEDEMQKLRDFEEAKLALAGDSEEKRRQIADQYARLRESAERSHQANLVQLGVQGKLSREQFTRLETSTKLQIVAGGFQAALGAMAQHNKTAFEMNKVAATANAIISAHEGISKTLATYPAPWSFAMAAAQGVAAFAAVSAIQSAQFGGGTGSAPVGGGGVGVGAIPGQATNSSVPFYSGQNSQSGSTAPSGQSAVQNTMHVSLTIQALDPSAINDATKQSIADSLAPSLQQAFGRGAQQSLVMV